MASAPLSEIDLEPTPPEVKRYQRQKLQASLVGAGLSLAWLVVMGVFAGPVLGEQYTAWFGDNEPLRLLASAVVLGVTLELLTLPLDFWSGYVLEHRYQLSNQTLGGWWWKRLKGYLVGGAIGLFLLYGLYFVLWLTGAWWWLWAAVGWLAVSLVLGRLLPVLILPLFYKVTPVQDASLVARLRALADGTGLEVEGVYELALSDETKKANAALAGLGRTRRVLLGDTLLQQFSPEEIDVVFAHEVGHHVYRHLPKIVAVGTLLALGGFWLVDLVLGTAAQRLGYQGPLDPAALPLLVLVLAVFGLVLSPLQNALSRHFERQCDRYALERTKNAAAYRSAFTKLARINKADPDPHPVLAWLFHDHPPIRQRIAMAELL